MAKFKEIIKQRRLPVARRLRVLLVTIVLLLTPTLIYFTYYISDQTNNFNDQNFRQLAGISDQIEQRIEGLKTAFSHAIENALKRHGAGATLSKDEFQQALSTASQQTVGTRFEAIDEETPIPKYAGQQEIERDFDSPKTDITLMPEGGTAWLLLVCEITHSFPNNQPARDFSFRARTKLKDLVSPVVGSRGIESLKGSEHDAGFDDVLIASLEEGGQGANQQAQESGGSSKVIFQQEASELDLASLDNLYRADDPEKTINFRNLSRSTNLVEVRLADSNYRLYLQPINFELKVDNSGKDNQAAAANSRAASNGQQGVARWVVCGLVQSSHFRHETWAFSYTLLIILAFAAALIALSWPFLRLMFMGCKDRLRLADAYVTASAMLVGSAILTLFILYGFTYYKSESELDERLKGFSDDISDHISCEIGEATAEIDGLNRKLKQDKSLLPGTDQPLNRPARTKSVAGRRVEGRAQILEGIKSDAYPYFSRAIWVDDAGWMNRQWTIYGSTSDYINVADRDYFKNLKMGTYRELNNQRFWLEPINSRLTGTKIVVISKPLYGENPQESGKIEGITTIVPSMLSLVDTVVPPGFGYRIIDSSGSDPGDDDRYEQGKVLFQSSKTQQQSENFFKECDNDHSLRSLIFGHRSGFVSVNYRGNAHRLYVSPMKGFPNWSLIVFRDKQVLRTVYLQMLSMAGSIFLFPYAVILLITFAFIYLIKICSQNRTEWIWPSKELSGVYRQTFFINLILCFIGMVVVGATDGTPAIILISLIAFTGILYLCLSLRLRPPFKRLDRIVQFFRINKLFSRSNDYVWNMVLLLILTGILPAAAFFKVAYNQEMKLFVKQGQIKIAKDMAEREVRVKSQYAPERADPPNLQLWKNRGVAEKFINRRLDDTLDVYDNFFFGTYHSFDQGPEKRPRDSNDSVAVFFASQVPLFNQNSLEQGGLIPSHAADEAWEWLEPSGDVLPLYLPPTQGSRPLYINTPLQRLNVTPLYMALMGLTFLPVLVTLFYLTRFVVRKIFLLDIDENLNISRLPKDAAKITENYFVVRSSISSPEVSFLTAGGFHKIDIAGDSKVRGWVEKIESQIGAKTLPDKIVVDNFDYWIVHPGRNDQKLKLVKALVEAEKLVVIISSCGPSACSFDKVANGKAAVQGENGIQTHHDGVDGQWAKIVSRFKQVYSSEKDDSGLEKAITDVEISFNARPNVSGRSRKRFERLLQLVRHESAPETFPQEVCVKIINQNGFEEMDPDCVINQILDKAGLYYQKVWDDCSEGERLTLLHLAQDRFLSPNDVDIKPLLQRGLIKRGPDIRFMTESFRRFVQSQSISGGLESIETLSIRTSPWEALRVPLLIIFVGVLLFLFLTQKNFYNSSLTVVTALTTGIPAFFKLLGIFQGDGGGSKA